MGGKDYFPIPKFCPPIFLVPILDLDSPKSGQGKLEGKIFDHSKKFYCGNVRRGAVLTRYLSFDHKSDNPTKSYFPTMGISFLESGIVGP